MQAPISNINEIIIHNKLKVTLDHIHSIILKLALLYFLHTYISILQQTAHFITMLIISLKRLVFHNSKNYVSQFKVRTRLAQFFKHIHPDQMSNAPTKIKDQNLRSLKNFNSYLDAINQQKPIQGKLLKFYISQKTNNKSRKFFSFNLELPQLDAEQAQLTEQKAEKLIDDIVNALNGKYRDSRNLLQGKKQDKQKISLQPEIKIQSQEQKFDRLQETTGPYSKPVHKYFEEERLKNAISAKFLENEKESLKLKLRQNMSFANTATNKPMMWSRIILGESGIYNDYQQILNNLIDPKLIYFSETITVPQIEQFKKKLLPGELDRMGIRATQAVIRVCEEMQSYTPAICLYVTTHYSATDIPGFFSIPYNFIPTQMLQKWREVKETIVVEREKYQNMYDYFEELKKQLQTKNRIKIRQPNFKNNEDISNKMVVLQRLLKYTLSIPKETVIFQGDEFKIFCNLYKKDTQQTVHIHNNKMFLLVSFQEEHLKTTIDALNQQNKLQAENTQ